MPLPSASDLGCEGKVLGDLFCESVAMGGEHSPGNFVESVHGFPVAYGRADGGSFGTLRCGSMADAARSKKFCRALGDVFRSFALGTLPTPPRRLLVLCLGNGKIAADSVGTEAASRLLAGKVGEGFASVIKTGVPLATGFHAADVAAAMANRMEAELAVCIDSLAAINPENVFSLFQVTDTGIRPGSGVSSHGEALNVRTVGIPVISIGVPTVFRGDGGRLFTLAAVEDEARLGGALAAGAVNSYLAAIKAQN